MLTWITVVAVIVTAALGWNLYRRFGVDRIDALNEKRRLSSRFVSRGQFVDGNRHVDVALALTQSTLFYENDGMEGALDLQWVREIEYDTELATGTAPPTGKVLRLRCYSQTFEFVLPTEVVPRWHLMLPPRRNNQPEVAAPAIADLAVSAR